MALERYLPVTMTGLMALGLAAALPAEENPTSGTIEYTVVSDRSFSISNRWAAVQADDGEIWVAHYDDDRRLWLRSPEGKISRMDDVDDDQAPSGLAMATRGDAPLVAWRDKWPTKGLYVKDVANESTTEVSQNTEALARFQLLPAETGTHALWYGELPNRDSGSAYNLHHAFIHDDGSVTDQRWVLPGIYPWSLTDGDTLAVFSWVMEGIDGPYIAMRRWSVGEDDFEDPLVLDRGVTNFSPVFSAQASEGHWLILWQTVARTGETNAFSLDGAYSQNRGETWNSFTVEPLKGFDAGSLRVVMDGREVAILVAGTWFETSESENILFLRSDDGGSTWSDPVSLRGRVPVESRALNAHLFAGQKDGELWAVWEDWREVRPRVYGAFSSDFGETFDWRGLPVSPQSLERVGLGRRQQVDLRHGDSLTLIAHRWKSDAFGPAELVTFPLNHEKIVDGERVARPPSDADVLRARVLTYWQAMADRDYETSYELLDPFLREVWSSRDYSRRMGRIRYRDFSVADVEFFGNVAAVTMRMTAWVPRFMSPAGKEIEVPEREIEFTERWLHLDGDWYREYEEEGSEIRFARY